MRGKLRDKRTTTRRDVSKREGSERQRPIKRDNRSMVRLSLQEVEDDFEFDLEDEELEDEEDEEATIEVPQKK
jgi:hypothetical protein